MAKRKQKKAIPFFRYYLTIALLLFGITAVLIHTVFPPPLTLHTLGKLPVPTAPTIYLPEPYIAMDMSKSVLGAETINPSDIVMYINSERMKRGSPPLRENKTLALAANMRANVILKYQNFAHQDPYEHIQLDTVLPMVHYPFRYASENIGMGDSSALGFVNGFMSSTSHRANLLNPDLQETGVAVVSGPFKQYYVNIAVEIFGIPATEEQYLGYKQEDLQQYRNLLTDINGQIALTKDRLENHVGDAQYYEGWQKILIRQQEILTTVYDTMLSQQPLAQNLIALIQQYNDNWNLVPKG